MRVIAPWSESPLEPMVRVRPMRAAPTRMPPTYAPPTGRRILSGVGPPQRAARGSVRGWGHGAGRRRPLARAGAQAHRRERAPRRWIARHTVGGPHHVAHHPVGGAPLGADLGVRMGPACRRELVTG